MQVVSLSMVSEAVLPTPWKPSIPSVFEQCGATPSAWSTQPTFSSLRGLTWTQTEKCSSVAALAELETKRASLPASCRSDGHALRCERCARRNAPMVGDTALALPPAPPVPVNGAELLLRPEPRLLPVTWSAGRRCTA